MDCSFSPGISDFEDCVIVGSARTVTEHNKIKVQRQKNATEKLNLTLLNKIILITNSHSDIITEISADWMFPC